MANTKEIDERLNARRQEIEGALAEIADTADKYFSVAPFQFIESENASPGDYLFHSKEKTPFNRFYEWNDVLMGKLFPEAHEAQRKLAERGDNEDEPGELAFAAQRFGFLVGVLVGMKTMGASRDELLRRSEGFVYPVIQCERARLESDAEREVDRG